MKHRRRSAPRLASIVLAALVANSTASHAQPLAPTAIIERRTAMMQEAGALIARSDYAGAAAVYRRLLAFDEAHAGPVSADVATTLTTLIHTHSFLCDFDEAERLATRLCDVQRRRSDATPDDVIAARLSLAGVHFMAGEFGLAEREIREALEAVPSSPSQAMHREAIAQMLLEIRLSLGDLEGARTLHQQVIRETEARYGARSSMAASASVLYATTLVRLGELDDAERVASRALASMTGRDPSSAANQYLALTTLASVYEARRDLRRADPLLRRAMQSLESMQNPDRVTANVSLALLALRLRDTARAEALFREAIAHIGPTTAPLTEVTTRVGFARALWIRGDHDGASREYARSIAISESRGAAPLALARGVLASAAVNELLAGRSAQGVALGVRALASSERHLWLLGAQTASRVAGLLSTVRWFDDHLVNVAVTRRDDEAARRLAAAAVLLHKGRAVDATAETSRALARDASPEDRARIATLASLRQRFAARSQQANSASATAALDALASQIDALEVELSLRSQALRDQRALPPPERIVEAVTSSLTPDQALIEYVRFSPVGAPPTGAPDAQGAPRYAAFVLRRDGCDVVDLGDAAAIEQAAQRMITALRTPDVRFADGGTAWQAPARALYDRVMAPLRGLLGARTRVLIAPDGALNLVPFAALRDERETLVDRFALSYLTSGRDLLRAPSPSSNRDVVIFADPTFDRAAAPPPPSANTTRGLSVTGLVPLPGTRAEANEISARFDSPTLRLGADATEEALLSVRAPRVLHVATHGLFAPRATQPTPEARVDPMLRSALVMAGARAVAISPTALTSGDASDGVVTALEVSSMNLWGTGLVVLSGCDTGRGDVVDGDSVYGLRRAVLTAGAETLVTSLWSVRDIATRDLMTRYYDALASGHPRASALGDAMRAARARRPHPMYWAGFIAIGRDAPLDLPMRASSPQ